MTNKLQIDMVDLGDISVPTSAFFNDVGNDDAPVANKFGMGSRAMFGEASGHNLATVGNVEGGSYLQGFPIGANSKTITGHAYFENQAQLASVSRIGIGVAGVSKTTPITQALGVVGAAYSQEGTQTSWGGYFDATRLETNAGNAFGIEVNAANPVSISPLGGSTPYRNYTTGMTNALRIAGGADKVVFGNSYAIDSMIEILNNGAPAHTGINFRFGSILQDDQTDEPRDPTQSSGYARAISLPYNYGLSWFSRDPSGAVGSGTQEEVFRITSKVTEADVFWEICAENQGLAFREKDDPTNNLFVIDYVADAGTLLAIVAGPVGGSPILEARGTNDNINLTVKAKGTGCFVVSPVTLREYADDAAAAAGGVSLYGFYDHPTKGIVRRKV